MKEVAQQILAAPFNWTGLTLAELVEAERIPKESIPQIAKDLAINFLSKKYEGQNPGIQQYLIEKDCLIAAIKEEIN